jgi:hypothetical protein
LHGLSGSQYGAFRLISLPLNQQRKRIALFLPYYKRKGVYFIRFFDQKEQTAHRVIGVTGTDSGIGVTHIALALATYCASKRRLKTALLEMHRRDELASLSASDLSSGCFRIHGFDCYPNSDSSDMPYLMNQGYDCMILDLGQIREADISELLRCDARYVICSLAQWKTRSLHEFPSYFDNSINIGESFRYLKQTGCSRDEISFSKEVTIPARKCRTVPFIKNPFCIEKELFLFFEELL